MNALGMVEVLEHVLARPLPQLVGCRHVLVIGGTSTGKTVLMKRIVDAIDGDVVIDVLDESMELRDHQNRARHYDRFGSAGNGHQAIVRGIARRPDVLAIGDLPNNAHDVLLEAFGDVSAPSIITTLWADIDQPNQDIMSSLRMIADSDVRDPCVAIIGMSRDMQGARTVKCAYAW